MPRPPPARSRRLPRPRLLHYPSRPELDHDPHARRLRPRRTLFHPPRLARPPNSSPNLTPRSETTTAPYHGHPARAFEIERIAFRSSPAPQPSDAQAAPLALLQMTASLAASSRR